MKSIIVLITVLFFSFGLQSICRAEETSEQQEQEIEQTENTVVFWELACHDAETSVKFFEEIFDWKIEMIPNTIIHGVKSSSGDQGINGGIFTLQKAKLPFLTVFILVDDINEKAQLIEENGGLIIEPPSQIGSGSWICLFNDPSGVTFAMLQPASTGE